MSHRVAACGLGEFSTIFLSDSLFWEKGRIIFCKLSSTKNKSSFFVFFFLSKKKKGWVCEGGTHMRGAGVDVLAK